jgi:hypothetical protein
MGVSPAPRQQPLGQPSRRGPRGGSIFQSLGSESPGAQYTRLYGDDVPQFACPEGQGGRQSSQPQQGQGSSYTAQFTDMPPHLTQQPNIMQASPSAHAGGTQSARLITPPAPPPRRRRRQRTENLDSFGPSQRACNQSALYWQQHPEEAGRLVNAQQQNLGDPALLPPKPCPYTFAPASIKRRCGWCKHEDRTCTRVKPPGRCYDCEKNNIECTYAPMAFNTSINIKLKMRMRTRDLI